MRATLTSFALGLRITAVLSSSPEIPFGKDRATSASASSTIDVSTALDGFAVLTPGPPPTSAQQNIAPGSAAPSITVPIANSSDALHTHSKLVSTLAKGTGAIAANTTQNKTLPFFDMDEYIAANYKHEDDGEDVVEEDGEDEGTFSQRSRGHKDVAEREGEDEGTSPQSLRWNNDFAEENGEDEGTSLHSSGSSSHSHSVKWQTFPKHKLASWKAANQPAHLTYAGTSRPLGGTNARWAAPPHVSQTPPARPVTSRPEFVRRRPNIQEAPWQAAHYNEPLSRGFRAKPWELPREEEQASVVVPPHRSVSAPWRPYSGRATAPPSPREHVVVQRPVWVRAPRKPYSGRAAVPLSPRDRAIARDLAARSRRAWPSKVAPAAPAVSDVRRLGYDWGDAGRLVAARPQRFQQPRASTSETLPAHIRNDHLRAAAAMQPVTLSRRRATQERMSTSVPTPPKAREVADDSRHSRHLVGARSTRATQPRGSTIEAAPAYELTIDIRAPVISSESRATQTKLGQKIHADLKVRKLGAKPRHAGHPVGVKSAQAKRPHASTFKAAPADMPKTDTRAAVARKPVISSKRRTAQSKVGTGVPTALKVAKLRSNATHAGHPVVRASVTRKPIIPSKKRATQTKAGTSVPGKMGSNARHADNSNDAKLAKAEKPHASTSIAAPAHVPKAGIHATAASKPVLSSKKRSRKTNVSTSVPTALKVGRLSANATDAGRPVVRATVARKLVISSKGLTTQSKVDTRVPPALKVRKLGSNATRAGHPVGVKSVQAKQPHASTFKTAPADMPKTDTRAAVARKLVISSQRGATQTDVGASVPTAVNVRKLGHNATHAGHPVVRATVDRKPVRSPKRRATQSKVGTGVPTALKVGNLRSNATHAGHPVVRAIFARKPVRSSKRRATQSRVDTSAPAALKVRNSVPNETHAGHLPGAKSAQAKQLHASTSKAAPAHVLKSDISATVAGQPIVSSTTAPSATVTPEARLAVQRLAANSTDISVNGIKPFDVAPARVAPSSHSVETDGSMPRVVPQPAGFIHPLKGMPDSSDVEDAEKTGNRTTSPMAPVALDLHVPKSTEELMASALDEDMALDSD